jgi:hypothetical protein
MRTSLLTDQWRVNGETVIVSIDGLLNDGQNRLKAVVDTGISIKTFVVWGVERDSRRTVDTGSIRLPGDFVAMEGGVDAVQAAAVAKWMMLYERGVYQDNACNTRVPTRPEITAYWMQHKDEIADAIRFIRRKSENILSARTPLCVAYIILSKINQTQADEFFNLVCDGLGDGWKSGSAPVALRNRLIAEKSKHAHTGEKLEIIIRSWNFWRRGNKRVASIPTHGVYPEVE